MVTLTLTDGTMIHGLTRNGTNFVSNTPVDESIFEDNLAVLLITENGEIEVKKNAYLVHQKRHPDGYYLAFDEKTENELLQDQILELQLAMIEMFEGQEEE